MIRSLVIPIIIVLVLTTAALWRGILGPGLVLWLAMMATLMFIRAPHEARQPNVAKSSKTRLEKWLLLCMAVGTFYLPVIWVFSPLLNFANRIQPMWSVALGLVFAIVGLYVFFRSHADLGTNWSVSLELREKHRLVTNGIYGRVRHPMYSALFLICIASAFLLPNWFVGPSAAIAFTALYFGRVSREEDMMRQKFRKDWDDYAATTPRLFPRF